MRKYAAKPNRQNTAIASPSLRQKKGQPKLSFDRLKSFSAQSE
jgi:hypothetical protein